MQRQFQPHRAKRFCSCATGTLLLALPFAGIALQLPAAQAQPAPTVPAKKSPLSPEQKAAIADVFTMAHEETLCNSVIDLKMENATLDDVMARIKALVPGQVVPVEVRGARPVKVNFDLQNARVGDVLTSVAGLAGCKLWVLGSGLLIAPQAQLTDKELADVKARHAGEWATSTSAGGNGWSNKSFGNLLMAKSIAQEVTGSSTTPFPATVVNTTFGNFSPEAQQMLQRMADQVTTGRYGEPDTPPLHLSTNSPVSVNTSDPRAVSISLAGGNSDPGSPIMVMKIILR